MSEASPPPSQGFVQLFEDSATTYDRVNTVISLGLDARWRRWVARHAVTHPRARVLDAFAGTGLVGLRAARLGAEVTLADASPKMLEQARRRAVRRGLEARTCLADLAAEHLPVLPGAPFDAVTMVFGVRYLDDPSAVIRRLGEQLAPGGRFVVMEFADADGGVLTRLAEFYFFRILPKVAGVLSGHPELYRTLAATTHRLGGPEHLVRIVEGAGLHVVETRVMGFGLVVGVLARQPL